MSVIFVYSVSVPRREPGLEILGGGTAVLGLGNKLGANLVAPAVVDNEFAAELAEINVGIVAVAGFGNLGALLLG